MEIEKKHTWNQYYDFNFFLQQLLLNQSRNLRKMIGKNTCGHLQVLVDLHPQVIH